MADVVDGIEGEETPTVEYEPTVEDRLRAVSPIHRVRVFRWAVSQARWQLRRYSSRRLGLSVLVMLAGLGLMLAIGHPPITRAAGATVTQAPETACSQTALQAALTAGQSTITFAPGCTIKLTSSLTIGAGVNITIDGNGLVIDGGSGFNPNQYPNQVVGSINFNDSKSSSSSLTLEDVTINGSVVDNSQNAAVRLVGSTITGTWVPPYGGVGIIAGSASLTDSTISYDVWASGLVTADRSTVSNGISGETVEVVGSTVGEGAIPQTGGGISATKSATVTNSTVVGTSNADLSAGTSAKVTGSVVGGISVGTEVNYIFNDANTVATVTDSTILGGVQAGTATITSSTVSSTISADSANLTADILNGPSGISPHCDTKSLTDGGYNLSPDDSCHFHAAGSTNNVKPSALVLLPLGANGGPTQTIALGTGSIAIDAIPLVGGRCVVGSQVDQRGVSRPQGNGCDIGAYEGATNFIYFPQTGNYLFGRFLSFWQHFGGLPVFGMPINDEYREGATGLTMQDFERARFEWHPGSDPARYDVELGLLGDEAAVTARQQTPAPFAPIQAADNADCTFYAQTGHRLCFGFRAYWESHGGLANFGYPISEEFRDPATGLTVQYFERAVFEYHPKDPVAYQVELRLLGDPYFGLQP